MIHHNQDIEMVEPCSSKGAPQRPTLSRQMPVDTGKVTEIWFTNASSTQFIRAAAMNDVTEGSFSQEMEYWYTSGSVAITGVASLTMASQSGVYDEEDIEDFFGAFSFAFSADQTIGTGGWTEGTRSPTGYQARLYKATDPDNVNRKIGLLIEMNSSNVLTAVTWYKMENTGTIFATTPSSLSFTLVTNANEQPSVDPADIEDVTWYHATMGS